jgi:tetratricopeptide (TPR) repeat protein
MTMNPHRLIDYFQKLIFSRYFSGILCLIILVFIGACAKHSVQKSLVTPATYEKIDTIEQRAYQAMAAGDYQTGIRLYERIIEKDPSNALAYYYLGYAYGQTGNRSKEVLYYEKSISLGYKTDQIFHNLGEAYLELGQIDESIQAFKQGLAINSKSADNHFGLAKALQETLNYDRAEEELLKTIRLEPKVIEFREFLGLFYVERGDLHKAAEQFEQILEIDPDHEGARAFLEQIVKGGTPEKKGIPGMGGD